MFLFYLFDKTRDPIEKIPFGVFLSPSFFFDVLPFFPITHLNSKSSNLRVLFD